MTPALKKTNINDKPIHVLHVASGDLWAGAEVMLYSLAKALYTELDVRVTVILLNHGTLEQKLHDCGIPVYVLDESRNNSFHVLQQLNKIVANEKPDVIHTHRSKENILGSITAWRNHIPSVRTTHGASEHRPPLYKLPQQLILFLDRFLGRYYQRYIIAVSSDMASKLEYSFPRPKINVIDNGIDINSLTANISQKQVKAGTANTGTKGNFRIGIAGRLVPVKRVDLFIEAAIYLKQHHPELSIQFHIYGDGPLQNTLTAQAHSQQAGNYIHFEGHSDNIAWELQTLNALLMTSDHEGLPMVLLEAMCLQVPIIAHAVGGIPKLLDHGECGTLVNDHSAQAFAEAILDLVTRPEHSQQLATKAFQRIKDNYSANHTATAYLKIYQQISS